MNDLSPQEWDITITTDQGVKRYVTTDTLPNIMDRLSAFLISLNDKSTPTT